MLFHALYLTLFVAISPVADEETSPLVSKAAFVIPVDDSSHSLVCLSSELVLLGKKRSLSIFNYKTGKLVSEKELTDEIFIVFHQPINSNEVLMLLNGTDLVTCNLIDYSIKVLFKCRSKILRSTVNLKCSLFAAIDVEKRFIVYDFKKRATLVDHEMEAARERPAVFDLRLSNDGKYCAVCFAGPSDQNRSGLLVVEATSGSSLYSYDTQNRGLYCAEFISNSNMICLHGPVSSEYGFANFLDYHDFKSKKIAGKRVILPNRLDFVRCSDDGSRLYGACLYGYVFTVTKGKCKVLYQLDEPRGGIENMCMSKDEGTVFILSRFGTLKMYIVDISLAHK